MRFLILVFLLFSIPTFGQKLDYGSVDRLTYLQFTNLQYDELKETGILALKQKIDFFYLRMRLGIAFYEGKNYEAALAHFKKAIEMNPMDTIAQEYLYYTYLFSGRPEDAADYAAHLPANMQQKMGYSQKSLELVSISGGLSFTNNISQNGHASLIKIPQQYGEATYNDQLMFASIFMQHSLSSRLKFSWGASLFNSAARSVVQTFKNSGTSEFANNQYQYNAGLSYKSGKGWNLGLGAGFFQQTISSFYGIPNPAPPALPSTFNMIKSDTSENAFAVNVNIHKRMGKIQPGMGYSYSNFGKLSHHQFDFSMLYFPLGNLNLYSLSAYSILQNSISSSDVISEKIGMKLFPRLFCEGMISYGKQSNYINEGTFLTYNTPDPIQLISGVDFKIFLKQLQLIVGYRLNQRQGKRIVVSDMNKPDQITISNFDYNIHLITTTLLWKF